MCGKQPTTLTKTQARRRARAISQCDKEILQTLQSSILQTTNYLDAEYTGTVLIARNTDPDAKKPLPTRTLRKDNGFLVYTHTLLPTSLHPSLNRLYVPHKTFLSEQDHTLRPEEALNERRVWVGMELGYSQTYRTPEDFFEALECAIEDPDGTFVVEYPDQARTKRAFMMEVRGYFRNLEDVRVAAFRHVDLLDQLFVEGYIILEKGESGSSA